MRASLRRRRSRRDEMKGMDLGGFLFLLVPLEQVRCLLYGPKVSLSVSSSTGAIIHSFSLSVCLSFIHRRRRANGSYLRAFTTYSPYVGNSMYLTVSILESRVQQGPSIVPRREQERENQKSKTKAKSSSSIRKKHVAPWSSIHHTCNAPPSLNKLFL